MNARGNLLQSCISFFCVLTAVQRLIIMRLSTIWLILGCAVPLLGNAQQPSKLEKLEEGDAPAVIIRKPDTEKKITEKREKGKVTEVKVQTGKSTYYLKPNEPAGAALPGDAESNENRGAQWSVHEFDLGRKKKGLKPPAEVSAEPMPPAPPSAK